MPQLRKIAVQPPAVIGGACALVVAVATWYAMQGGDISWLLFFFLGLAASGADAMGTAPSNLVVALVGALVFLLHVGMRRTPESDEQIARFNRSTCLWLLVYLVALFWFVDIDL